MTELEARVYKIVQELGHSPVEPGRIRPSRIYGVGPETITRVLFDLPLAGPNGFPPTVRNGYEHVMRKGTVIGALRRLEAAHFVERDMRGSVENYYRPRSLLEIVAAVANEET